MMRSMIARVCLSMICNYKKIKHVQCCKKRNRLNGKTLSIETGKIVEQASG